MDENPSVIIPWAIVLVVTATGCWSLGCGLAKAIPKSFSVPGRVILCEIAGLSTIPLWVYISERLVDARRYDYLASHPSVQGFVSIDPSPAMVWSIGATAVAVAVFRGTKRAAEQGVPADRRPVAAHEGFG